MTHLLNSYLVMTHFLNSYLIMVWDLYCVVDDEMPEPDVLTAAVKRIFGQPELFQAGEITYPVGQGLSSLNERSSFTRWLNVP